MPQQMHNNRSEVIHQAVIDRSKADGFSWRALSDRVVELWVEMTPEHERTLAFRVDPHPAFHEKHNGDKLAAMFNPNRTVRPPIELEEPIVLALEEFGDTEIKTTLARRYGFYGIEIREGDHTYSDIAAFTKEFSEGLAALSAHKVTGDAQATIKELLDVVASAESLIAQIRARAKQ